MTIMIGCPIQRNRCWILPRYLNAILNLDYPKEDIHLAFLVNGKQRDNTACVLEKFKTKHENTYSTIDLWYLDDDYTDDRIARDYQHFADIRNTWISMRRKTDTHIFSVDSDIIVKEDTLSRLINHQKPVTSTLICNGHLGPFVYYNILNKSPKQDEPDATVYCHVDPVMSGLTPVDVTGACYLIDVDVINEGAMYSNHFQGEDVGFCEQAKALGFGIYCDQSIELPHIMNKDVNDNVLC